MLAFILMFIISLAWAVLINQIWLTQLAKAVKIALVAVCYILIIFTTLFPILITPFLTKWTDGKIQIFNKKYFALSVLFLALISARDFADRLEFEYRCHVKKDYEINIVNKNFKKEDIDNFYIDWISYSRPKSTQKVHTINVYDKFEGSVVAEVYTIYLPNGFIANELHKMTVGGNESGTNCGYIDRNSGFVKRDDIKTVLKNNF